MERYVHHFFKQWYCPRTRDIVGLYHYKAIGNLLLTNTIYMHCKKTIQKIQSNFGFQYEPESCLFKNSYLYSLLTNKAFLKNVATKKPHGATMVVGMSPRNSEIHSSLPFFSHNFQFLRNNFFMIQRVSQIFERWLSLYFLWGSKKPCKDRTLLKLTI